MRNNEFEDEFLQENKENIDPITGIHSPRNKKKNKTRNVLKEIGQVKIENAELEELFDRIEEWEGIHKDLREL